MQDKEIIVSITLNEKHVRIGRLWFHNRKGKESVSFEYEKSWLTHPDRFALEPALTLTEGTFHAHCSQGVFGAIGDSSPDRWGRVLMRRAETARARALGETPKTLLESDFLLGVNDTLRQGALRFSNALSEDVFLTSEDTGAIPPLVDLPKLLQASDRFLQDGDQADDIKLLLAPGSSLGGARPKASVIEKDGTLSIAKFPRKDDEFDVVVWEAVALSLAERAGVEVPEWRLESVLGRPVLIVKRFDRNGEHRIPFLSAMSMLGAQDNEQRSYLEIAYALAKYSMFPNQDMAELWRRIVFTIMISNTDDHLRNHGFLYGSDTGWRLSPVYDINPTPVELKPRILSTAIDFDDTSADLETALQVAGEFRVSPDQASSIIKEVKDAVALWRQVALGFGISRSECDRMSSAFLLDKS